MRQRSNSMSTARGPWARLTPRIVTGGLGATLLFGGVVLGLGWWELVLASHPAYGVCLVVVCAIGAGLLLKAVLSTSHRRSWNPRTLLGVGGLTLATLIVLGSVVWLLPFSASREALATMAGSRAVRVTETSTSITLEPSMTAAAGLVFQPGARVDARAYVPILQKVAEQGFLVVIVKQPVGIGLLAIDAPAAVIKERPEVRHWAVGGHSLGGVAAASYAAKDERVGLVLWASYPASSLADRTTLKVVSVSGSLDGLSTPVKVEAAKQLLPADATYVVIPGAVHAYFGDYGSQPGDGAPTVTREVAQTEIARATVDLLSSL